MPLVAICPRCASQLGLPSDAERGVQLECPVCEVEFAFDSVAPRELLQARVLAHAHVEPLNGHGDDEIEAIEPAPALTAHESLSRLLRETANWQPKVAPASSEAASLREAFEAAALDGEPAEPADDAGEATADAAQPAASHGLKLGSSRLDQLLSDLMKKPAESYPPAGYEVSGVYVEEQYAASGDAVGRGDDGEEAAYVAEPGQRTRATHHREGGGELEPASQYPDHGGEFAEESYAEEHDSDDQLHADEDEGVSLDLYAPRPRRRRMLALASGGVFALLAVNYALLWLLGPGGDLLAMARWLPAAAVPSTQQEMAQEADAESALAALSADRPRQAVMDAATPFDASAPQPLGDATGEASAAPPPSDEPSPALAATQPRLDPAVTQATAVSPVSVAAPRSPGTDVIWPATPIVGDLRGVKLYSVEDLTAVVEAAGPACQQFLEGDLDRVESRGAMGKAFMDVAALAERYTLTDPAAYGNDLIAEQLVAKDVFRAMAGDPARRGDLAIIAARWLQHDRRQNQGVVLLGRIGDMRPQGPWTECVMEVGSGDAAMQCLVLLDRIRASIGSDLAVAGAIIAEPQRRISGYQGDASQVVVAGFAFSPQEFAAPAVDNDVLLPY